jgi:hypothetical protein
LTESGSAKAKFIKKSRSVINLKNIKILKNLCFILQKKYKV